ncbi:Hypothetical protein PBC10988_23340 [Planctomycetales bacterium 10988]|nr:Hypothetical protein PBC10988_23340 [Planctomycetales bacterium 10988]
MGGAKRLQELHQRLLAEDPTAPPEIATLLLTPLCEDLRRKYSSRRYVDFIHHAVEDALINYFQRPEQYNPTKGELQVYLRMSALGDLRNALRKEQRFQEKFQSGVEISQIAGKIEREEDCTLSILRTKELSTEVRNLFPEELDWQMVELIMNKERRTEVFAEILGITHWSQEDQCSEVKRHKDRIKKILRRFGDSIRESTEPE